MRKTVAFIITILLCIAAFGQKYKDCHAFDLKGDVKSCTTTYPGGDKVVLHFTEEGALVDDKKEVVRDTDGFPKIMVRKHDIDSIAEDPLLLFAMTFLYDTGNDTTEYVFVGENLFIARCGNKATQYRVAGDDITVAHHISYTQSDYDLAFYLDEEGYDVNPIKGTIAYDIYYQVQDRDDKGNWTKRKVVDGRDKSEAYEYREITYWEEDLMATASCDFSLKGLIDYPLGINTRKGWSCPWEKFLPIAQKFYGTYREGIGDVTFSNPILELCGEPVSSVWMHYGQKYHADPGEYHIKYLHYFVDLHTPRAYKIEQKLLGARSKLKESECQWDKESVLAYFEKVLGELKNAGWDLQKKKSRIYECCKDGRKIQLHYGYIRDKSFDYYYVCLYISNKLDDNGFYIAED